MIEVKRLTAETVSQLWTIEDRRLDSEKVIVKPKPGGFDLDYKALPGALWRVGNSQRDVPNDIEAWMDDPEKGIYLAWLEDQLAGQIILARKSLNVAQILDLRVSMSMRRRGIGESMIALAEDWAKSKELMGLMAETQDVNAGACQFLTQCGFVLGGVDMLRYAARSRNTLQAAGLRESALFFYKFIK